MRLYIRQKAQFNEALFYIVFGRNILGIRILVNKQNIAVVEIDAFNKINRTIDSIEAALTEWNSLKQKPSFLRSKMLKYSGMKTALETWINDFVKRDVDESYKDRLKRLQDFVDICEIYR